MLEAMKKEISKDIQKAESVGKVEAKDIKEITEKAVSKVVKSAKDGVVDMNEIAKEAVATTVAELKSANNATKEHIKAAVTGVIDGISKSTKESINKIDMEILKAKYQLQEKRERLSANLKDGLNGAKEAATAFSDELKADIEEAVTDTKLTSINILGLMEETIKHSVKTVINEGEDVEAKIAKIAKEATQNALSIGKLNIQKAKEVSQEVILTSIESAEEVGKYIKEVTRGAIEGTEQGLTTTVEELKEKLKEVKEETSDFIEEDTKQIIEDLKLLEDTFIEVLNNTANQVGDIAKSAIEDSKKEIKENVSQLKQVASDAVEVAIDCLKEKGSQFAYSAKKEALKVAEVTKEEIAALSERMVKVTKGAFNGMVDGIKKAIEKK